jgi:hypothetical protein
VIKGQFANGSPLLAIPNYVRFNRGAGNPPAGDAPTRGRGGAGGSPSIVWLRDQ